MRNTETQPFDKFCADHDWWFEATDYCPECGGAERERERIIEMLKSEIDDCFCPVSQTLRWAIAQIGGEKYEERCHGCDYLKPDLKLEWINGEELVLVCDECLNGEAE
jgi:hypothetical protein